MNRILEDPTDDTKGFFDPNTQENLSYLDLMERFVQPFLDVLTYKKFYTFFCLF